MKGTIDKKIREELSDMRDMVTSDFMEKLHKLIQEYSILYYEDVDMFEKLSASDIIASLEIIKHRFIEDVLGVVECRKDFKKQIDNL